LIFLPSGLSTIVTAMLCGRLLNGAKPLMAPQGLIALGMVGFALSMWMLSHLSPQSGEGDIQLALIIRGASMGFLLTPITVASLSSLRAAEIAQGAGLTNLFRQLGGSFGIAVINTYLTQMTDTHRSYLVGDIFSGNQSLGQRHSGLAEHLIAHGYSAASASGVAMGMVDRSVQVQSQTMAYNDSFQLICLAFVLALPALFLLRKGR
jgi:DHA2 family multidrug resistance protein